MVTPSGDMSPTSPDINGLPSYHQQLFGQRKQREFIPDQEKDDTYWDRRRRNNEAAKRSREKRRVNDMMLESRVMELTKENNLLRAQLEAVYDHYAVVSRNTGFTFQLPPLPRALAHIIQPQVPPPLPVHPVSGPMPRLRFAQGTFANPRIPELQTIDQIRMADQNRHQLQQLIRRNEQEQQEQQQQQHREQQENNMQQSQVTPPHEQDHDSRTPEPEHGDHDNAMHAEQAMPMHPQQQQQPRRMMTPPETASAAAAAAAAGTLYHRIRSQSLGEHARTFAAAAVAAAVNDSRDHSHHEQHHEQSDSSEALNLSYAHSSSDRSGSPTEAVHCQGKQGSVSPASDSAGSGGPNEFDEAYHSSASSPGNNTHMPFKIRFKGESHAQAAAHKRKLSESDDPEQEDQSRPKNLKVDAY